MWRWWLLGGLFGLGWGVGYATRPPPGAPHAEVEAVALPAPAIETTRTQPARSEARSCAEQIAFLHRMKARLQQQAEGTPVPFDDELPSEVLPDAVRAEVEASGCTVRHLDCDEYPCMLFAGPDCSLLRSEWEPHLTRADYVRSIVDADGQPVTVFPLVRVAADREIPRRPPSDAGDRNAYRRAVLSHSPTTWIQRSSLVPSKPACGGSPRPVQSWGSRPSTVVNTRV